MAALKYLEEKYNKAKPYIMKTITNTAQGYVFGCIVGILTPSSSCNFKSMHNSGKTFAKVSAIYSTTESVLDNFRGKNDLYTSFVSGALAGGLGASTRGNAAIGGALVFGLYSGLSDFYNDKQLIKK